MNQKSGVIVKKSKFKIDSRKIFTILSKAVINSFTGDFNSITKEITSIRKLPSDNASNLAYELILRALVNAAYELSKDFKNQFGDEFKNSDKLYDNDKFILFLDGISNVIDEKEIVFEYEHFKNPKSLSILEDFQEYFYNYLIIFGVTEGDSKIISNRLPDYFVLELNNEWIRDPSKYKLLLDRLSNPFSRLTFREEKVNKDSNKKDEIRENTNKISPGESLEERNLFISYSRNDSDFVNCIENHLKKANFKFWRDIHDATSGPLDRIIDNAIEYNKTVLLILSKNSVKSDWVEFEIEKARQLEKKLGRYVLCPISLDNSWEESDWSNVLVNQIMKYNILDFSIWENGEEMKNQFDKLVRGLVLYY
mgnify:CR=1 FL=1